MEKRPGQVSPRSRPQKKPSAGRSGVLKVRIRASDEDFYAGGKARHSPAYNHSEGG
jgi:hypothetical protein